MPTDCPTMPSALYKARHRGCGKTGMGLAAPWLTRRFRVVAQPNGGGDHLERSPHKLREAATLRIFLFFRGFFILSQHTNKATTIGEFAYYRYFVGLSLLQG